MIGYVFGPNGLACLIKFGCFILGQKPHECIKCGKRFALGCNMKAHLKTHDTNRSLNDSKDEINEEEMVIKEEEEEMMLNVTD